jgi:hypothetical protein
VTAELTNATSYDLAVNYKPLLVQAYLARSLCTYAGYVAAQELWRTLTCSDPGSLDAEELAATHGLDLLTVEALQEGLEILGSHRQPVDSNPWLAFERLGIEVAANPPTGIIPID